ncbi:MAG: hypothetical protein QM779_15160 [Propionicimonas sp.]|uniref:hypothetical protein n=1 Tax=Propionicimonas sp. TaxID=1955623 RepID=UPI003D0A3F85
MSGTPPTWEPEQRWQQPAFGEPVSGAQPVPALPVPVAPEPPGTVEKLAGRLHGLVWVIAIALVIFIHTSLVATVVVATVAGFVLNHIRRDLRRQRLARAGSPVPRPPDQEELR